VTRLSLTLASEDVALALSPEASRALLRAERQALLTRIAVRLLSREPGASANAFYGLVGGRKADALEAFRAARRAQEALDTGSAISGSESGRSGPGPATGGVEP